MIGLRWLGRRYKVLNHLSLMQKQCLFIVVVANKINLDSSVSNYAVFGNPIRHSKSPQIHSLFAEQTGITLYYQAIEVPTEKFSEYVKLFSHQGGKGLNITVPFKEEACSICTTLSQRAEISGSVNTILFDEQSNIYGDTTDGQGLINDLIINQGIKIENKSVLILGAGGSVKAILEALCAQKTSQIYSEPHCFSCRLASITLTGLTTIMMAG